jgi:hypothetical protein
MTVVWGEVDIHKPSKEKVTDWIKTEMSCLNFNKLGSLISNDQTYDDRKYFVRS